MICIFMLMQECISVAGMHQCSAASVYKRTKSELSILNCSDQYRESTTSQ